MAEGEARAAQLCGVRALPRDVVEPAEGNLSRHEEAWLAVGRRNRSGSLRRVRLRIAPSGAVARLSCRQEV